MAQKAYRFFGARPRIWPRVLPLLSQLGSKIRVRIWLGSRTFKTSPKSSLCPEVPKCEAKRRSPCDRSIQRQRDGPASASDGCTPSLHRPGCIWNQVESFGAYEAHSRGIGERYDRFKIGHFPSGPTPECAGPYKAGALSLILKCVFLSLTPNNL